jgi:hypothetical protein
MNVASTFQTVKYDRDNSSFITRIPADKMSITIAYPDDVELYAQSRNAGELNILNRGSTSGIVVATIEEPIFPGGGFEFWWRRTRTEEERKVGARTTPPPGGPAGAAST